MKFSYKPKEKKKVFKPYQIVIDFETIADEVKLYRLQQDAFVSDVDSDVDDFLKEITSQTPNRG